MSVSVIMMVMATLNISNKIDTETDFLIGDVMMEASHTHYQYQQSDGSSYYYVNQLFHAIRLQR